MKLRTELLIYFWPQRPSASDSGKFSPLSQESATNRVYSLAFIDWKRAIPMSQSKKTAAQLVQEIRSNLDNLQEELQQQNRQRCQVVGVTISDYDIQGKRLGEQRLDLSVESISQIIDKAAHLAIVMRDMAAKKRGSDAFNKVFGDLDDALLSAEVITDDINPVPVMQMLD